MKRNQEIRRLLADLHYHQIMVRVAIRSVISGMEKCRQIGKRLRELQRNQK